MWCYSSAIQTWFEHIFDSDILPLTFEFDLLFELKELGMNEAKNAFILRIYERYKEGDDKGRSFLIKKGYIGYVLDEHNNPEELRSLIKDKKVLEEFDKFFAYYSRCS